MNSGESKALIQAISSGVVQLTEAMDADFSWTRKERSGISRLLPSGRISVAKRRCRRPLIEAQGRRGRPPSAGKSPALHGRRAPASLYNDFALWFGPKGRYVLYKMAEQGLCWRRATFCAQTSSFPDAGREK
jgi:hypothetical protein